MTIPGPEWYTSSYSKNQGQCVEVKAVAPTTVHVRDSQNPGPELDFAAGEWQELIDRVKFSDV